MGSLQLNAVSEKLLKIKKKKKRGSEDWPLTSQDEDSFLRFGVLPHPWSESNLTQSRPRGRGGSYGQEARSFFQQSGRCFMAVLSTFPP